MRKEGGGERMESRGDTKYKKGNERLRIKIRNKEVDKMRKKGRGKETKTVRK